MMSCSSLAAFKILKSLWQFDYYESRFDLNVLEFILLGIYWSSCIMCRLILFHQIWQVWAIICSHILCALFSLLFDFHYICYVYWVILFHYFIINKNIRFSVVLAESHKWCSCLIVCLVCLIRGAWVAQ